MKFSTIKKITDEPLPNQIITYISDKEDLLIEIKAKFLLENELNLMTTWYTQMDAPQLLDCYKLVEREINTYDEIDYEVAFGNHNRGRGTKKERVVSFKILDKTLNPLTMARQDDTAIGFNTNYGGFWFQGENINKGAEEINVISGDNLAKLVSVLALKSGLIKSEERIDMETILDLTYDFYLNDNRSKLTILR